MFEPFTKVASQNSNSWFPTYSSAKEISTPNENNRFIGFPYTKYMNAIMEVDQSASLIIMSEKKQMNILFQNQKNLSSWLCRY